MIRAAARNHASWFRAAAGATGGEPVKTRGLSWVAPPPGGEASVPFPREPSRPALDELLARCREHDVAGIGCWATGLEPHTELAARLVARGFEWGWQPHWMAQELTALPLEDRLTSWPGTGAREVQVELVDEVPEYDGYGAALLALTRARPQRSWHAVARVDGKFAGHAWAHLTGGKLGCAGVYDVDVVPWRRRRGIGRALTLAVCRAAAAAGARTATLNATGDGELLYTAMGFRSLGKGQTWWIHRNGLAERPPPELTAAAEAAGRGDVEALERLDPGPDLLAAKLPGNGMDLWQVAIAAGQRPAAEWIAARGGQPRSPTGT
jgi:hypothetical protein